MLLLSTIRLIIIIVKRIARLAVVQVIKQCDRLGRRDGAVCANGVIGGGNVPVFTNAANGRLREWFVLAILFAPDQFVSTTATAVINGRS